MELTGGMNMKKFAYVIAAIAAAFAVSCTKETPLETPNTDAPAEVGMRDLLEYMVLRGLGKILLQK